MGFYDAIRIGASGATDTGYTVDRSVRISRDTGNYFSISRSSDGNRKKWTLSFWFKRGKISTSGDFLPILSWYLTGNTRNGFVIKENGGFHYQLRIGSYKAIIDPVEFFRDPSAWYHVVFIQDTENSTQADRVITYVNGRRITISSGSLLMAQNEVSYINSTSTHYLGHDGHYGTGDFYLADVNFIDGQAYDPTYFAETDATTGQWIPKEYTNGYSGNSFYLKFDDNSGTTATTLGKDSSGLGNNVTPVNFSVSAGAGNHSLTDTPTNNFCTLNSLEPISGTLTNGNLNWALNASKGARGTFFVSSGKWYFEAVVTAGTNAPSYTLFGIQRNTGSLSGGLPYDGYGFLLFPTKYDGSSGSTFSVGSTSFNDVIGIAFDLDNKDIYFYRNGSLLGGGAAFSSITAGEYSPFIGNYTTSNNDMTGFVNFGQRPFAHTPPTGYKALSSANLPDPTILLPNEHFDTLLYTGTGSSQNITGLQYQPDWVWIKKRNGAENHELQDAVRGATKRIASNATDAESTVAGSISAFNSDGFTVVDAGSTNENGNTYVAWNWNAGDTDGKTYTVKVVSDGGNKYRFDDFGTSAVTLDLAEGGTYIFDGADSSMASHPIKLSETSNGTHGGGSSYNTGVTYLLDGASVTESAYVSGYSSATTRQLKIVVAASAPQLFYYCHYHSGMGGAINTNSLLGSSNFDGTVQATVKASPTAGVSIVSYNVPSGSGYSVGHGLGAAPQSIFVKNRDTNSNWDVYNVNIGNTKRLKLNSNAAEETQPAFNNQTPTSTVFYGLGGGSWHGVGSKMINYVLCPVEGFSKFGSYTGNGSSDGPFISTGFRPAWVLIKNSGASGFDWVLQDATRSTFNAADKKLNPNTSAAEQTGNDRIDILSNGFKLVDSSAGINASSSSYIYLAFAESPFKNARAR